MESSVLCCLNLNLHLWSISDYDVPVLNHSITDLDGDIENAKNYSI